MNKKITIRDVAQAAGVSISTVHQALNDKPGVSEVTREHIRRIADDLGYRPNKMASGLKRRTQRVAVLLPDEVVEKTVAKYKEAFELLTGKPFQA